MSENTPAPKGIGNAVSDQNRLRGIGDVIAKITKSVGIPQCGACKKRQEALNAAFPFKDKSDK